jgi:phosphatidate cytidylyltransferase
VSAESTAPEGTTPDEPPPPKGGIRTGRNLLAAIWVGLLLGAAALVTLLTVKATFLIYMGAALLLALHELDSALRKSRDIKIPVIPVALGGAAMVTCAYWAAGGAVMAAFSLTLVGILIWRLFGGTTGYVADVTAAVFAAGYLGLFGATVSAMLSPHDGGRRVLAFIIITICTDIGGYFAGITLGRTGHKMAPAISPKKTWEGLAGSVVASVAAGAIVLPVALHGYWWQGAVLGAAVVAAAVFGDLAESMIKRDLEIKDMGSLLPGHGGVLDRIDSLLVSAPVAWLLLAVFLR